MIVFEQEEAVVDEADAEPGEMLAETTADSCCAGLDEPHIAQTSIERM